MRTLFSAALVALVCVPLAAEVAPRPDAISGEPTIDDLTDLLLLACGPGVMQNETQVRTLLDTGESYHCHKPTPPGTVFAWTLQSASVTGLTEGAMLIGGTDGGVAEDPAAFFADTATGGLGLGTTSPDAAIHLVTPWAVGVPAPHIQIESTTSGLNWKVGMWYIDGRLVFSPTTTGTPLVIFDPSGISRFRRPGGAGPVLILTSATPSIQLTNLLGVIYELGQTTISGEWTGKRDGVSFIHSDASGQLGVGNTTNPTAPLDVVGGTWRLRSSFTPASSSAVCSAGTMSWDSDYKYACVSSDTWVRVAHSTW